MTKNTPELFDTCILIDYLSGVPGAKDEFEAATEPAISHITWIEVMVGVMPGSEAATRRFLGRFQVFELNVPVGERAVSVRQGKVPGLAKKPKLPDAIIMASAAENSRVLVTRNTKDFSAATPGVRIPAYSV